MGDPGRTGGLQDYHSDCVRNNIVQLSCDPSAFRPDRLCLLGHFPFAF
jgi:hypothetical protein